MGNNDLLQETFNLLDKRYGINRIKRADELPRTKDSIVSTGIIGLDTALGVGGIKKGSIIEVYVLKGLVRLRLHCRYAGSIKNRASRYCT